MRVATLPLLAAVVGAAILPSVHSSIMKTRPGAEGEGLTSYPGC